MFQRTEQVDDVNFRSRRNAILLTYIYFLIVFLNEDPKENIMKYFHIIPSNKHGVHGVYGVCGDILVKRHSLVEQYTLCDCKAKDKINDKSIVF
jgi:hypothetical protein